jgi:putative flippase GtrA
VTAVDAVLDRMPPSLRDRAMANREVIKFLAVGGTTFVVDTAVFFLLKSTVLDTKPVTAKVVAVLVATILNYVLNREWSFRTRGGRETHHEAFLFFLVSAIGLAINSAPLWVSSYVLDLRVPDVSPLTENVADFVSAQLVGTLLATAFRWWAFRRYVFPDSVTDGEELAAAVNPAPADAVPGTTTAPDPRATALSDDPELGHS